MITCVATTVGTATDEVPRVVTEVRERTETQFKESAETVFESSDTIGTCEVGQSGRRGSQEGILREEFLVTFTETFDVTFVNRFRVTTTTTVTSTFLGTLSNPTGSVTRSNVERVLQSTTKTGEELVSSVETGREKVGETVNRVKVGEEFTPTGKCKNNPGEQDNRGKGLGQTATAAP